MDQSHSNILGKMGFISWLQATKNWRIIPLEITSVSFLTLKLLKDPHTASTLFWRLYRQFAIYNMSHYLPSWYISFELPQFNSQQVLFFLRRVWSFAKRSIYKCSKEANNFRRAFRKRNYYENTIWKTNQLTF